jgi:cell filamentation protein
MTYNYSYIDPDYKYTDLKTGILRNIPNLTDKQDLDNFEIFITTQRLNELKLNPIPIKDISSLLDIHKFLFKDITIGQEKHEK